MRLPLGDPRVIDLLAWWGTAYSFGAGEPKHAATNWPPKPPPVGIRGGAGIDCSGLAQVCLVRLGLLSSGAPDRGAAGLFAVSEPVPAGGERLGDLAFYGSGAVSHVVVLLAPDVILGANGGHSSTNGDDPAAFVKIDRLHHRPDFLGVRRISGGLA